MRIVGSSKEFLLPYLTIFNNIFLFLRYGVRGNEESLSIAFEVEGGSSPGYAVEGS